MCFVLLHNFILSVKALSLWSVVLCASWWTSRQYQIIKLQWSQLTILVFALVKLLLFTMHYIYSEDWRGTRCSFLIHRKTESHMTMMLTRNNIFWPVDKAVTWHEPFRCIRMSWAVTWRCHSAVDCWVPGDWDPLQSTVVTDVWARRAAGPTCSDDVTLQSTDCRGVESLNGW